MTVSMSIELPLLSKYLRTFGTNLSHFKQRLNF